MHKDHKDIEPVDDGLTVWRYMDLSKFVSLLSTSSVFFARADRLGEPFEGSLPRNTGELHRDVYNFIRQPDSEEEYDKVAGFAPKTVAISCWHINAHESDAMWKLYLASREGIAIRSTIARLKDSWEDDPHHIYLGRVNYINYEDDYFDVGKQYARFLHKRKSFEHEMEVRGITDIGWRLGRGKDYSEREPNAVAGVPVKVSLHDLIEKVYVAPTSPGWFKDVVQSLVTKFGLEDISVETSGMDERPLF